LKNISAHSQCDWESSSLTAKLITTDLENHSDYSAGAIALSAEGAAITGAGVGYESESQTSLTRSAISQGTITITDEAKQLELTGKTAEETIANINTDTANAHTALEKLPDLKQLLADQQAMAGAASTVISVSNQIASDIAGNAEKTKDNLKNEFGNTLSPEDQQIYNSLTPTQKESVLLQNADTTTIAAYNEAQTTISHWGVGGDYSRALGVVTNIIVGVTAGATSTQLTANAVAPYAAELIGNTFDHTDDPNQVAQLLSHAVLGGVLAYANGGNAANGALAGAGAEAASLAIAKELYPDAFDADGTFHRDRLSEGQANAILALSGAVGAFVGGVSGGGINNAVIDANVAQNAVENNAMNTNDSNKVIRDWLTGKGSKERIYGPENEMTKELMTDPAISALKEDFLKNYTNVGDKKYYAVKFGITDFLFANSNTLENIGSYGLSIYRTGDNKLTFYITNEMGLNSFSAGLLPNIKSGPMSTIQTNFWWEETIK
jgi:hypothetical protein